MGVVSSVLGECIQLWTAIAPFLLLGTLIAGLLHVLLRQELIARHLGGGSCAALLKATLLGVPLPLCSCGVIPVAESLRREGASRSATLAFLASTPTTGVDSILATYALLGPLFAVLRPLGALLAGFAAGALCRLWVGQEAVVSPTCSHPEPASRGWALEAARHGFLELSHRMGRWLLVGVLLGGLLSALLPPGSLRAGGGWEFAAVLLAAVPLYVCATGSIPVAAALLSKGCSPGAVLAFLMVGPATNTVTISFVWSRLGRRALVAYLGSILAVALGLGLLLNAIWPTLGPTALAPQGEALPGWLRMACGVVLFGLVMWGLAAGGRSVEGMRHLVRVPDMACHRCALRIERELRSIQGVGRVVVDLDRRLVGVEGEVSRADVLRAVRRAGYVVEQEGATKE